MGKVCACIAEKETARALAAAEEARRMGADTVEFRLDLMETFDLASLVTKRPLPAIVTFRSPDQGGGREVPDDERLKYLNQAVGLGVEYVDVEHGLEAKISARKRTQVISSFHDFEAFPPDLAETVASMDKANSDITKVAVATADAHECLQLYGLLLEAKKPMIALGVGEGGVSSRVLSLKYGAYLTYASLNEAVAPGQVPLDEMVKLYRAKEISHSTAVYGVIGRPLAHSLSPAMHNSAFAAVGLDAVYVPLLVRKNPAGFARSMAELGGVGFSVTIPHKVAAMNAADELEPFARKIGAINTLVVRGRKLLGANTDAAAAVSAVERASGSLRGKKVLLLGAGGAGRAIAFALAARGARLVVANRTEDRGRSLAKEAGASFVPMSELSRASFDVLVNATSVGMHPKTNETPIRQGLIPENAVVFDAVYNPIRTRLLREAAERGAKTVDGLTMFVDQGAAQFRMWTGLEPPIEIMREEALKRLEG